MIKRLFLKKLLAVLSIAVLCVVCIAETSLAVLPIPTETTWAKRQLRGAWVSTVVNLDWPSSTGLTMVQQQSEFIQILDQMKGMGLNAVIVQIRPAADAFYVSQINPWSKYLTGTQGQNPGYDPLAFMIQEARKRNMEFHAWFNPYRVSMDTNLNALVPTHPARLHPDWVVSYGNKLYYDPGIPDVKTHIIDTIMEVVQNYDIDAVHFDDYFYPYPISGVNFPDDATYNTYGKKQFPNKADWRRNNVNTLISDLSAAIKAAKPQVKFGVSPFGIWRNKSTDPTGSDTSGLQSYDALYVDTRKWIQQGWLDYVTPQIYWNFGYPAAAYEKLIDWWTNETRGRNTRLYIGHAAYKIGADNAAWNNPDELPNQLKYNLQFPEITGSMLFRVGNLLANPLGIKDRLTNDIFKYQALVDTMPWLDNVPPAAPVLQSATRQMDGVLMSWTDSDSTTAYFVIYRFAEGDPIDLTNSKKIISTVQKTGSSISYTDTSAVSGTSYTYVVTSLDRLHNESAASNSITVPAN